MERHERCSISGRFGFRLRRGRSPSEREGFPVAFGVSGPSVKYHYSHRFSTNSVRRESDRRSPLANSQPAAISRGGGGGRRCDGSREKRRRKACWAPSPSPSVQFVRFLSRRRGSSGLLVRGRAAATAFGVRASRLVFGVFFRDASRGHCQAGSLTGAVHLSKDNAGVPRPAQRGQKPRVEQKGKCWLDPDFQYEYGP